MLISWVLLVTLFNRQDPIALQAVNRQHCLKLIEQVNTMKEYHSSVCYPLFNLDKTELGQ